MILGVSMLSVLMAIHTVTALIYLLLLFLSFVWLARVEWRVLGKGIFAVWPLIVLTLGLHLLMGGGVSLNLADLSQIHVNYMKMQSAALFTGRLVVIVSVSVALFALYSPGQMAREVGRWLAFLPLGRRSVAQAELLTALALRFVPLMGREYERLQLALAARGETASGRIAKLRGWRRIMYPLMVNAFRRADHVAIALQARGYDPVVVRTSYSYRAVSGREWIATLVAVALVLVALWL